MNPVLVTAPTAEVVSVAELRDYLRASGDDDAVIAGLAAAVVAHLDGWTGILGRCIRSQVWSVDLPKGKSTLPFPDVVSATVNGQAIEIEPGGVVDLSEASSVVMICDLPAHQRDRVKTMVKLAVGALFENRDATLDSLGGGFEAMVKSFRVVR